MKKKIIFLSLLLGALLVVSACGEKHTCAKCGKTTYEAYYDIDMDIDYVMCKDCAQKYWVPFDYKTYRVK